MVPVRGFMISLLVWRGGTVCAGGGRRGERVGRGGGVVFGGVGKQLRMSFGSWHSGASRGGEGACLRLRERLKPPAAVMIASLKEVLRLGMTGVIVVGETSSSSMLAAVFGFRNEKFRNCFAISGSTLTCSTYQVSSAGLASWSIM